MLAATERCNGNGACKKLSGGVMCPSYMATRDEVHAPRGRANTLRAAITGEIPGFDPTHEGLYEAMDGFGCRKRKVFRILDGLSAPESGALERSYNKHYGHERTLRAELRDELNKRAFRDTLPRFALRPAALDHGRYSRMAQFLKDRGLIKTVPMINDYAVELK